jgi:hypothetical protein
MRSIAGNLLSLLLLVLLSGCAEEGTDPSTGGYKVTGSVVTASGPQQDASVSIDAVLNWTTTTDAQGRYEVQGVTGGTHTIVVAKAGTDGGFTERTATIVVQGDLALQSLQLPLPVILEAPAEVSSSQLRLVWHPTDAADFREYKLFRKTNAGLDETTGELTFVSTFRAETTFVDASTLVGQTYYYRLYVMNDVGRLGGSNLVSKEVAVRNLIPDGSFESPASFARYWSYSTTRQDIAVTVDSSVSHSARYSLHVSFTYSINGTAVPVNLIGPIRLRPNVLYKLSYFLKVKGRRNNTDDLFVNVNQQGVSVSTAAIVANRDHSVGDVDADWAEWSQTFLVTSDTPISVVFIANNENVWLDDITLIPQ